MYSNTALYWLCLFLEYRSSFTNTSAFEKKLDIYKQYVVYYVFVPPPANNAYCDESNNNFITDFPRDIFIPPSIIVHQIFPFLLSLSNQKSFYFFLYYLIPKMLIKIIDIFHHTILLIVF